MEIKREVAVHFQKMFKDHGKLKMELTGEVGRVIRQTEVLALESEFTKIEVWEALKT